MTKKSPDHGNHFAGKAPSTYYLLDDTRSESPGLAFFPRVKKHLAQASGELEVFKNSSGQIEHVTDPPVLPWSAPAIAAEPCIQKCGVSLCISAVGRDLLILTELVQALLPVTYSF